jgi:hypothetical protein
MRTALLTLAVVLGGAAGAQAQAAAPAAAQPAKPAPKSIPATDRIRVTPDHPQFTRCCHEKVWDALGHEVGDLISYDERFASLPLEGFVAYHLKGGDAVVLSVYPTFIQGLQGPGGSSALFATPDCSGNTMFAMLSNPPLAKRYAMVLPYGTLPYAYTATQAWLWATDALPPYVTALPPGTVFHSQWGESQHCDPIAAPGYTPTPNYGGYWMHRVEDLYAKFTRPFYVDY